MIDQELVNLLGSSIQYFELLAIFTGIIFINKYKDSFLIYFLLILIYTFLNEQLGTLYKAYIDGNNLILYNIYNLINFSFLFLLYYKSIQSEKFKKWTKYFFIFYLLSFIINVIFFENFYTEYSSISYIIAASLLLITIMLYFIEILNSEEILHLKKNLLFWISSGLLVYFVAAIPIRVLINNYISETELYILFFVKNILAIMMYLLFTIGFICMKKK